MTLKDLEQHNKDVLAKFWPKEPGPQPNGIACPRCGAELLDTNPSAMLLTSPPQFNIHCPECPFTGTRY
jgi:hypothetical protein